MAGLVVWEVPAGTVVAGLKEPFGPELFLIAIDAVSASLVPFPFGVQGLDLLWNMTLDQLENKQLC